MAQPEPEITEIRVYYEDTDAGGVVFYANYLKYLERARTEWLRSRGVEQRLLAEEADVVFAVVEVSLRYRRPARLDDLLAVSAEVNDISRSRVVFEQEVRRAEDGELLVSGQVEVACLSASGFRARRIPDDLMRTLTGANAR